MRVQTNTINEPVSFTFGEYEVIVQFNPLLLMYDAEIHRISGRGKWLVTKTGGKSIEQASMKARQIILGKDSADILNDLNDD
tara:strand:- start:738 stop:983 length:246 start_codon:yes stop_codon:yes gene_type:complete